MGMVFLTSSTDGGKVGVNTDQVAYVKEKSVGQKGSVLVTLQGPVLVNETFEEIFGETVTEADLIEIELRLKNLLNQLLPHAREMSDQLRQETQQ